LSADIRGLRESFGAYRRQRNGKRPGDVEPAWVWVTSPSSDRDIVGRLRELGL